MSESIDPQKPNACPDCGAPLSEAAAGLCPRCLMNDAAQPTHAHGSAPGGEPPPIEEVRAAFPQFEILEMIGRGGMGTAWKARQPGLNRHVALKLLPASLAERDPAFAERFAREGELLARLHHPNIVAVHDSGRAGHFFYLLMEFVDGVNLRQAMRASRFTPMQALAIVPRICDAIQYAHDEGVLHRDIKPENILLDTKGRVKLVDFGIAKLIHQPDAPFAEAGRSMAAAAGGGSLTLGDTTLGTPNYMAPEQIEKPSEVDNRADIYSLGVVFYELLTGELPRGPFAPPSEKSQSDPRIDGIVRQALEKQREHRQKSAGEMRTQVETISSGEAAAGSKPRLAQGDQSFAALWPTLFLHAGLLVLMCATFLFIIPRFQMTFADFGATLPAVTQLFLALDHFSLLAILAITIGVDAAICVLMRQLGGRRALFWWSAFGVACWMLVAGLSWFCLTLPLAKMTEQISSAGRNRFPRGESIVGSKNSVMLMHDGQDVHYVFYSPGGFSTSTSGSSNTHSLTWMDEGAILLDGNGPTFGYHRESTDPTHLRVNGREYNLEAGRVFVVRENGTLEQRALEVSLQVARDGAKLGALVREDKTAAAQPAKVEWAPEPGAKPDLQKIFGEAQALRERGRYEEALDRHVWLHKHGLEIDPGYSAVRLSFWLSQWMELARHYPRAKQVLLEIRDHDARELAEGRGHFDLFMEVASINDYLQEQPATLALFKQIEKADPALAKQCAPLMEEAAKKAATP